MGLKSANYRNGEIFQIAHNSLLYLVINLILNTILVFYSSYIQSKLRSVWDITCQPFLDMNFIAYRYVMHIYDGHMTFENKADSLRQPF